MKKNLLALAVSIGVSTASFGQATLTAANFNPQLNDAFQTRNCNITSPWPFSPGPSGASITWNYGGLSAFAAETNIGRAVTVASTSSMVSSLFYTAVNSNSSIAVATPTGSLISYSSITGTSKLSATGVYRSATENTYYTDPMDQVQYPLTYNSKFSDTYAGYVTYLGTPIHGSGVIFDTCDGWGSLILPAAPPATGTTTYTNVLRVHSSQSYIDSANLFGNGVDTFQTETYTWYAPNYHSALLTVANTTGVGLASSIKYTLVSYAEKKISDAKAPSISGIDETLKLFPNPASNELNLQFYVSGNTQVRISIEDMLGREMAVIADKTLQGAQSIRYNTNTLPKGLYMVQLHTGSETVSRKIEIQ